MKYRMMILLLAALVLLTALVGCSAAKAETQQPETTQAAAVSTAEAVTDPAPTDAPETTESERKTAAVACIGQSVDSLFEAIGQPDSSSYASSCDGSGEDGELYYGDFTVYTYRENGAETVTDVW